MTYDTQQPTCPRCGSGVEPTWDWCHACGYDPEGHRAAAEAQLAGAPSAAPPVPMPMPMPQPPAFAPTAPPAPPTPPVPTWTPYPGSGAGPPGAASTPPGKSGSSRSSMFIVGGVALAAVLVLVAVVARHKSPPPLTATELTPTTHAGQDWVKLTEPTHKFSVDFPGQWTDSTPPVDGGTEHDYTYTSSSVFTPGEYILAVADFGEVAIPSGWEQAFLSKMAESMAQGGLTKADHGTFAGHNSLEIAGTTADGGPIQGVVFIDHTTIYILVTDKQASKADTDHFITSFHFN